MFNREHKFTDNLLEPASGYPIGSVVRQRVLRPAPERERRNTRSPLIGNSISENSAMACSIPARRGFTIDRNVYVVPDRAKLMLIGVPWRDRYRTLSSLATIRTYGGWEANGRVVDPDHARVVRQPAGSSAPADVNVWVARGWKLTSSPVR